MLGPKGWAQSPQREREGRVTASHGKTEMGEASSSVQTEYKVGVGRWPGR